MECAHGGAQPIATVKNPGGSPLGCSVDPTTGNLAVTNEFSPGDVEIYQDAQGTPKIYSDGGFAFYYFCGCDNHGNLFITGGGTSDFAELPRGNSKFTNITLNLRNFPWQVQWDGKYMTLADYYSNGIYRVTAPAVNPPGSPHTALRSRGRSCIAA